MATVVEAVGWDITLGLADTGIGKLFLWATSACENSVPEFIDHVGIKVFGYLYEYGDCGILRTKVPNDGNPVSKYPTFSLRAVENVGETSKTREEFESWILEQNRGEFHGSRYDIVGQSCIIWAMEATKFLGVTYPPNWDKIVKYAHSHKTIASALGGSIVTSRQLSFEPLGTYE
ncbi:unnamed protein product [Allacma fusca]|uniref:PPPDE domain-containing protein n=1 Tax=Allacma fusca TaxID=39272 RepID=A0A8J2PN62_9HEXA|nr:unnamed protein product [Allacma fusca]